MKKNNFLLLFCLSFIFVSCDKDPDDLIITMNNAGTLTFNVIDGTTPLAGAKIQIYDGYNQLIVEDTADHTGNFTTEKLIEGNYNCNISYSHNNINYYENKIAQVIATNNKVVKSNPLANVTTVRAYIYQWNNLPVAGINVILVPYNNDYWSIWDIVAKAHFSSKTDESGFAIFDKVPAEVDYRIMVYNNEKTNYNYYHFIGDKGKETNISFSFY